jgi:hypothetical protein
MRSANLAAAIVLCAAAVALISCADSVAPSAGGAQRQASGWYVEQVEEGFGHIDQLPKNWSGVPSRQHTALFTGAASQ